MKTVKILSVIVLTVAVLMICAGVFLTVSERNVPYDDIGAFYHAKVELTAIFHIFTGGCLLLADCIWGVVKYFIFKKRKSGCRDNDIISLE